VVSARRGLVVDGVATLNGVGILYRSMLLPLSEDGVTIDHLLGAVSYRALRSNEGRPTQVNFRRLPIVPPRAAVAKRRPGVKSEPRAIGETISNRSPAVATIRSPIFNGDDPRCDSQPKMCGSGRIALGN
jgi:hypothetical protein